MSKKNACLVTFDDDGFEYHCLWDEECYYRLRSECDSVNCYFHECGNYCNNMKARLRALDELERKVRTEFIRLRLLRNEQENGVADDN